MDLLLLGGLGYAISRMDKGEADRAETMSESQSSDTVYSNNSSKNIKDTIKKKALKKKKLHKKKKLKISSPVKKPKQKLLISESSEDSESMNQRNQDLSNLDSNYEYQNQFSNLKYDCKEPMALNGLDRDELRHIVGERELFAMGAPIQKDMTYDVVPTEEFKHHNMQHFTKMNGLKHDIHTWNNRNSLRDKQCGYNEFYNPKKEVKAMFKPQKDVHGGGKMGQNKVSIVNQADRFIPGKEKRNQLPFEQIKVTPGLNLGYNEEGQQGRHDAYKPPMKSVNELRPKNRQKVSLKKPVLQTIKKGTKPAIKPKMKRRGPEKVFKLKHGQTTRKGNYVGKRNYKPKNFYMKKTDRGKKKKSLGVKQAAVTRNLPEDQRAIVKKPIKVQPSAVEPANKKNRVGMYEPNMQNFVMPCTQRNSTNVSGLPGPAHADLGSRVRDGNGLKVTMKQTTLYDRDGNVSGLINKPKTFDPNDKAKTTMKEQNLFNRDGNVGGLYNKPKTFDPNDKAKTTIKEQNLFNRDGNVSGLINKPKTFDPNNKAKTTKKEQILFNRDGNINSLINKPKTFDPNDTPKITIKQTTIENKRDGNMRAFEQPTYQIDYKDVPATTLKELVIGYQRAGIAKGLISKAQTINYNDIPAKTLKDMIIENKYVPGLYNVSAASGGYLSTTYKAPTTLKEALNNVYRVGVVHSSGIGGYISNHARAKTTLRQMVHVFRLSGIGKYLTNHRLYAAEYNAETAPKREIISKGRQPTTRKQDMPIGKDQTNIRKKHFTNSARPQHAVMPIVGRTKFNQKLSTRPVENKRNDLTIAARQLQDNVFVIKR